MASSSQNIFQGPPYPDVFADEAQPLTDSTKKTLLTSKWDAVHEYGFPSRYIGEKFRKIQTHWFVNNTWLRYSESKGGVHCAPCYLFGEKETTSKQKLLTAVAVTDPSNIGKLMKNYEPTPLHSDACEAAHNFLAVMDGKQKDIMCSLSSAHDRLVEKNRHILEAIVDTIIGAAMDRGVLYCRTLF